MVGSWIKLRHALWHHPKVVTLASRLSVTKAHAIGALACAWFIADAHATKSGAVSMTAESLDALVELQGFSAELQRIGWLKVADDSLQFLNYQQHNGPTAKARAMSQKRAQSSRSRNGRVTRGAHEKRTREEKRREEVNTPPTPRKRGERRTRAERQAEREEREREEARRQRDEEIRQQFEAREAEALERARIEAERNGEAGCADG